VASSRMRLRRRLHVTPRQIDILSLVAEGRSGKEVASLLGLSVATVRTHLGRFYSANSLRNRVEAVTAFRQYREARGGTTVSHR
jgi:DNA-binding CsgD family transcriptional regulator